jgi:hypothetical protein
MTRLLTLAAMAGFACGARHFGNYLNEKRKRALDERKLEVWEGEGGAVPVRAMRTTAQVRPRRPSKASPRGVS